MFTSPAVGYLLFSLALVSFLLPLLAGINEPLTPGTTLRTPPVQGLPTDRIPLAQGADPDEVTLLIAGARFRKWTQLSLTRNLDGPPTLSFSSPWDPADPELRRVFRPFSFHPVDVFVGNQRIYTGVLLSPAPTTTAQSATITGVSYGRTGVLADCTPSASSFPLQFDQALLPDISRRLTRDFGIAAQFDEPAGGAFEYLSLGAGSTILPFLAKLARQRNLVIGETAEGGLLYYRSIIGGQPVAELTQGEGAIFSGSARFEPQSMFSDITGIAPAIIGVPGGQATVRNPHLQGVLRPHTFQADDSQAGGLTRAVDAKASRMFGNMAAWEVATPSWRNPRDGQLWAPNNTVRATCPDCMVYNPYNMLVRSVVFAATPQAQTATLTLVVPEAFAGLVPETLPWDE